MSKASPADFAKMGVDTASVVKNSSPEVAYHTIKHHTQSLEGIKMVYEKINSLIESGGSVIPNGMKYLHGQSQSQSGATTSVLSGPLSQAKVRVLSLLEKASGLKSIDMNAVFQFEGNNGDIIRMTAKDIMAGGFDNNGVAIYQKVPGVMSNIISKFGDAMQCLKPTITSTNMPENSTLCAQQIDQAYNYQNEMFSTLNSNYWSDMFAMSLLQTSTIVIGAGIALSFAGFLPVQSVVQYFAWRSAPAVAVASRIGINELKTMYETASTLGLPILNELKNQILNNPSETARAFARAAGFG